MQVSINSKITFHARLFKLSRMFITLSLYLCGASSLLVNIEGVDCHAQQDSANVQTKPLVINALQIDANKMPFPGERITLRAEVSNTRDFRLPIRLLAVRDGKFYEISAASGLLGSNERPQYQVEIPAPLAELSYQFVLIQPNGTVATSKRLVARRSCIPDITPVMGEMPADVDGSERFNRLIVDNLKLEQEISNLERTAQELDSISELLAK